MRYQPVASASVAILGTLTNAAPTAFDNHRIVNFEEVEPPASRNIFDYTTARDAALSTTPLGDHPPPLTDDIDPLFGRPPPPTGRPPPPTSSQFLSYPQQQSTFWREPTLTPTAYVITPDSAVGYSPSSTMRRSRAWADPSPTPAAPYEEITPYLETFAPTPTYYSHSAPYVYGNEYYCMGEDCEDEEYEDEEEDDGDYEDEDDNIFDAQCPAPRILTMPDSMEGVRDNFMVLQKLDYAPTFSSRMDVLQRYDGDEAFVFDFDDPPDDAQHDSAGGSVVTAFGSNFPATYGTGLSLAVFNLEACGIVPPHSHPRADESVIVTEGKLVTQFLADDGTPVVTNKLSTDQATVFPQGSVHVEFNPTCGTTSFVSAYNSDDPGNSVVFPPLGNQKSSAYPVSGCYVDSIRNYVPPDIVLAVERCLDRCGISQSNILRKRDTIIEEEEVEEEEIVVESSTSAPEAAVENEPVISVATSDETERVATTSLVEALPTAFVPDAVQDGKVAEKNSTPAVNFDSWSDFLFGESSKSSRGHDYYDDYDDYDDDYYEHGHSDDDWDYDSDDDDYDDYYYDRDPYYSSERSVLEQERQRQRERDNERDRQLEMERSSRRNSDSRHQWDDDYDGTGRQYRESSREYGRDRYSDNRSGRQPYRDYDRDGGYDRHYDSDFGGYDQDLDYGYSRDSYNNEMDYGFDRGSDYSGRSRDRGSRGSGGRSAASRNSTGGRTSDYDYMYDDDYLMEENRPATSRSNRERSRGRGSASMDREHDRDHDREYSGYSRRRPTNSRNGSRRERRPYAHNELKSRPYARRNSTYDPEMAELEREAQRDRARSKSRARERSMDRGMSRHDGRGSVARKRPGNSTLDGEHTHSKRPDHHQTSKKPSSRKHRSHDIMKDDGPFVQKKVVMDNAAEEPTVAYPSNEEAKYTNSSSTYYRELPKDAEFRQDAVIRNYTYDDGSRRSGYYDSDRNRPYEPYELPRGRKMLPPESNKDRITREREIEREELAAKEREKERYREYMDLQREREFQRRPMRRGYGNGFYSPYSEPYGWDRHGQYDDAYFNPDDPYARYEHDNVDRYYDPYGPRPRYSRPYRPLPPPPPRYYYDDGCDCGYYGDSDYQCSSEFHYYRDDDGDYWVEEYTDYDHFTDDPYYGYPHHRYPQANVAAIPKGSPKSQKVEAHQLKKQPKAAENVHPKVTNGV
ncbi:hypothetical protein TRICI_004679 [Trichomonascus ciferrii]|uniref:Cupin type-1 domain-containing protein n=1 Tax=Trichomonascus ciferrii TaxID=44093 RepID=A0A642UZP5_9ASCO|nr:hypothetical protein TRICI_004679 [Trichomonascus ciferrii]